MTAPKWLDAVIREFGEGVDIRDFGFNEHGAASMRFETGVSLHFEYALESLLVSLQIPVSHDGENMRRLLLYTQPERMPSFPMRVAYLEKSASAVMVAKISEREASLATVNAIFTELWLMAEDFRRRIA